MASFYGKVPKVSRMWSKCKEAVWFQPLIPQEFLVSHLIILRRIKAWVELGASQNPTPGTPGLVIQQILQMPFLLCINDLPEDIICNITIYADDTTLCTKCDQASDLWRQLQLASELESETLWTGAQGSLLMSLLEKLNLLQLPV